MNKGYSVAWGRPGAVPAAQAHGGQQVEPHDVAAGGMPYEGENNHPATATKFVCKAIRKDGEPCGSWTASDTPFCGGHLLQLDKLNKKIEACEDEAERLILEDERLRKWL